MLTASRVLVIVKIGNSKPEITEVGGEVFFFSFSLPPASETEASLYVTIWLLTIRRLPTARAHSPRPLPALMGSLSSIPSFSRRRGGGSQLTALYLRAPLPHRLHRPPARGNIIALLLLFFFFRLLLFHRGDTARLRGPRPPPRPRHGALRGQLALEDLALLDAASSPSFICDVSACV